MHSLTHYSRSSTHLEFSALKLKAKLYLLIPVVFLFFLTLPRPGSGVRCAPELQTHVFGPNPAVGSRHG